MGWKPEFLVSGTWSKNALVFATKEEAEANARDLFMRWTMPSEWRAVEVDEAPNYAWDPLEGLKRLEGACT
jgi:hypothetical protein